MKNPSLPALTLYADAELFNVIGDIIFQEYPDFFRWPNRMGEFEVTAPPQVAFLADGGPHNMSVTVTAKLTFKDTTMFFRVTVFGCIHVREGVLGVHNLLVRSDTGSRMFNALLNGTLGMVLEHVAAMFDGLRLPSFHNIFGLDLDARLLSAEVCDVGKDKPVLCLIASFGPSQSPHHRVTPHAGHQLNAMSRGVGTLEAIVPEYALNSALALLFDGLRQRINRRWRVFYFFIARLRGRIQVKKIRIRLKGKVSTVRAKVRFRKLRGGAGFVGFTWIPLGIRRVRVAIGAALETRDNGRKAVFDIKSVEKVDVDFRLNLLSVPIWVFQQMFDDALRVFNRKFRRKVKDTPPAELFKFDDTIPRTDLPADIRFAPGGLAFHTGFLSATVLVSPKPEQVDYATLPVPHTSIGLTSVKSERVEQGEGRPIIFVHGWSLDHSYWQAQLDHFSDQYRTIAYDLRGMGQTEGGSLPYDLDRLARDLRDFLDELGIEKPVLCGHSLGGSVILRYAHEFPDRFSALICADVPAPGVNPSNPFSRDRIQDNLLDASQQDTRSEKILALLAPRFRDLFWSKGFQKSHPKVITAWRKQFLTNSLLGLSTAQLSLITRLDLRGKLSDLGVPSLVLRGSRDLAISAQEAQNLTKELGAEFKEIQDSGHMSPVEKPTEVNAALAAFLERHYPADGS